MAKQAHGLGKGLGDILGLGNTGADALGTIRKPVAYVNQEIVGKDTRTNSGDVFRIHTDEIEPNPYQPRSVFDQEALEELAASIRTLGLIQPLTVRRLNSGKYQIISGERRFKACCLAGLETIPAYIRETDDQGMIEMAIVENVQRENLDPMEIAISYRRLMDECDLTQEQMSQRIGKKRSSVANYLRLLNLTAKAQHDLKVGLMSLGHAKVLLGVDDATLQDALCDEIVRNGLSVRQLEEKIKRLHKTPAPKEEETELPEVYGKVLGAIGKVFDDRISVKRNAAGKGTISIKFNSDAEVEEFLKLLDGRE